MEQLDSLASAEPLSMEDDLVLRMSASAKVRGGKDERKKKPLAFSPTKGIGKRKQPRRQAQQASRASMEVEGATITRDGKASGRRSALAVGAAAAVVKDAAKHSDTMSGVPLKRSHSI